MYIWEKQIEAISIDWTTVKFVDWTEQKFTEAQLKYIVTEEPMDAWHFQSLVLENVATDVLWVLQSHNIRKWDLQGVIETVVSSFNQNFLIAVGKAFGTYAEWKYPQQCQEDITMEQIIQMKDS